VKDRYDAKLAALSGGEQQRVAIARALVNQPTLLLADEPTGNLDAEAAALTMRSLLEIHQRGVTVVIASHDGHLIRRFGGRVVTLVRGMIKGDKLGANIEENPV
jgi:cell division transport system ATP-binding protein